MHKLNHLKRHSTSKTTMPMRQSLIIYYFSWQNVGFSLPHFQPASLVGDPEVSAPCTTLIPLLVSMLKTVNQYHSCREVKRWFLFFYVAILHRTQSQRAHLHVRLMHRYKLWCNLSESKLIQTSPCTQAFKHSNLFHHWIVLVSNGIIQRHSKLVYTGIITVHV